MYHEYFANNGRAWVPDSDLTQEECDARVREREAANARYREIEARQHQEVRDGWKLTVGKLKSILADLPDDMPVIVQEELGIRDVVPTVDDNHTTSQDRSSTWVVGEPLRLNAILDTL